MTEIRETELEAAPVTPAERGALTTATPETPRADLDAPGTHWERVATTRWGTYISEVERRALLKAHELAPEPGEALEVGAEGGRWSELLSDLGWSMTCTDVNPDTLQRCQQRVPEATCIVVDRDSTTLPVETGSVGLLACIEVMEIFGKPWFTQEAARVVAPGGLMMGVFTNGRSPRGLVKRLTASITGELDRYARGYPPWRADLERAGLEVVHEEGICWWPFTRASNSPLIPAAVALERRLGLRRLTSISPWVVLVARRRPLTS